LLGQQPLRQEDCLLNEVIASFEPVLRRASKESLNFMVLPAAALPQVHIDSGQFESALLNLIVNASDATPNGGSITVRTEKVHLQQGEVGALAAGDYVCVCVDDTGAGMTKDVAAKAIDPFFTTKPIGQGTGLGLSQAYGLAQQSGGDLQIRSEPGLGTTVSLYFPALAQTSGKPAAQMKREIALVVDDQTDVREMAVELFDSMGYHVLSASNGLEALQILEQTPMIDVLFSDVVMPGMSGVKLAQEARQRRPGMKIILVSGYAPDAMAEDSKVFDFEFISKPYSMAQIIRHLRSAPGAITNGPALNAS
jgi:CheY-like chemotaxis protein